MVVYVLPFPNYFVKLIHVYGIIFMIVKIELFSFLLLYLLNAFVQLFELLF